MKVFRRTIGRCLGITRTAIRRLLPTPVREFLKLCTPPILRYEGRQRFVGAIRKRVFGSSGTSACRELLPAGMTTERLCDRYRDAHMLPENTLDDLRCKAKSYRDLAAETRLDRARVLRVMARLGEMAGEVEKAALYRLRAMRLLGRDIYGDLDHVRLIFTEKGYTREASVISAMYGTDSNRLDGCERLLHEARERCRIKLRETTFAYVEDRRQAGTPRVSVILTVYNAADKIPTFLRALQLQTLNRRGELELIVVDSSSPKDELAPLKQTELAFPVPYLYVRTAERETIQTAWNRAISLARAPYLSLLGVDETVLPEALADLAGHLDQDPNLDWVQADCLVTEVDAHGTLIQDVQTFDRAGYVPHLVYLDSCYLGPVGALYRKSIHDRFGWFDGSFRGAGDTEFKLRMQPFIRTKHVPQMYGVFLNYPDERMTASPRAEIEDYRAWHLHRTAGGMRYAMKDKSPDEAEALLRACLGYRKSYKQHRSTDLDLAESLMPILKAKKPTSLLCAQESALKAILQTYRDLDHLPGIQPVLIESTLNRALTALQNKSEPLNGPLEIFNDNRHEHHHWYW